LRYAVPILGPEPAKAVGYLAAAGIQTLTEDYIEVGAVVTADDSSEAAERVLGALPAGYRAGTPRPTGDAGSST
jgi:hypothetical protein